MNARPRTPDMDQFLALLLQRRTALTASLREALSASGQGNPATRGGEVHDWKDDAFAEALKNTQSTEIAHLQTDLAAVRAALQRIEDGTYGDCVDCGREIGRERLQVQPAAPRCLACQQKAELGAAKPRIATGL